jgi:serine protease Do
MGYLPDAKNNVTRRFVSLFVVLFVLGLGIGIGTLISYRVVAVGPRDSQLKIQSGGAVPANSAIQALSQAFEEVAKRVGPSVVNINTEEVRRASRPGSGRNNQIPDIWRQFMPDMPQEYTVSSLGSGIIVDPKGYIITNNHVVQSATKIKVNVKDGKEYQARVIAGDNLSDIAVIKIDGDKDFPYAKIGNAKAMKVGDWVIAVGSPFGLEQTVTAGIVSAIGRVFEQAEEQAMLFNDYLQTDASINPGNSGGPLVNMNGEVVGINSFISTASRASAGVGFAVPSHIFVDVYNQILEKGKVSRGWMGVNMNMGFPFTPAMAEYFGVKQGSGVLITGLNDEKGNPSTTGPAARAGIQPEDVIVEFDGKKISGVQDLRLAVANTPPGRKVSVKAVRFGTIKDFAVTVAERTLEENQSQRGFSFDEKPEPKQEIGMRINNVPPREARELNISGGALVLSVSPGSLAEDAGLRPQDQLGFDVIVAASGKKVEVAQDLLEILKNLKSGQSVVIKFLRAQVGPSGMLPPSTFYTSLTKP